MGDHTEQFRCSEKSPVRHLCIPAPGLWFPGARYAANTRSLSKDTEIHRESECLTV